jgi:hypothetical protein
MTVMALFRHGVMSDLSPPSGVERKSHFSAGKTAFDPFRTSRSTKIANLCGDALVWRFLRPRMFELI